MSRRAAAVIGSLLMLVAAEGIVLGIWWFRDPARAHAASPALRGREVARNLGCFACHGSEGLAGIPNPGAMSGDVPSWAGGTYMMFNESPTETREWILDGIPARLADDPKDRERRTHQFLFMPSYRGRVGDRDLEDLIAYVQSVSAAYRPEEGSPAAAGRELAVEHGCFGCHGPEGRGLVLNPGSLKGFIPPWDSDDYRELVRSPDEFREWVASGELRRLRENPAAAYFLDRQVVKMPAFSDLISEEEIENLRAYVEWSRDRLGAQAPADH